MPADLSPFVERVSRAKRWLRLAALAPALPIVGALLVPFPDEVPFMVIRWGFIGLCLMTSVALLSSGLGSPANAPAIRALRNPETVCWLFIERSTNRQSGAQGAPVLQIGLVSGERLGLQVEDGEEDRLLDLAFAVAPHATRGWSAERELRFLQQPTSLVGG